MLTNNREYYIQLLKAEQVNLPKSVRIELINLLLSLTMWPPPTVTLVQRNITPLTVRSGFPHLVEFKDGALSAEKTNAASCSSIRPR